MKACQTGLHLCLECVKTQVVGGMDGVGSSSWNIERNVDIKEYKEVDDGPDRHLDIQRSQKVLELSKRDVRAGRKDRVHSRWNQEGKSNHGRARRRCRLFIERVVFLPIRSTQYTGGSGNSLQIVRSSRYCHLPVTHRFRLPNRLTMYVSPYLHPWCLLLVFLFPSVWKVPRPNWIIYTWTRFGTVCSKTV